MQAAEEHPAECLHIHSRSHNCSNTPVLEYAYVDYGGYKPAYYGPFVMSVPAFTVERRKEEEISGLLIAAAYFTASINRVRVFFFKE